MPVFSVHITSGDLESASASLRNASMPADIWGPGTAVREGGEPVSGSILVARVDAPDAESALERVREVLPGYDVKLRG